MHCVQQLQQKQCLQSGVWTHRHGPCCSEAVPGLRRVQQARVTARWQTLRAKLIKALARKSAASGLKLHQEQLAAQCCMQTRSREAAKAAKPRITELLGVRVLSAPAASCSHCLQRAAARRAGALLPSASLHSKHIGGQSSVHADCLRKRWGAAYPASVTPQAGERSAHLAAPSKLQKALRPSSSTCLLHKI